jgi:hypothetical protein
MGFVEDFFSTLESYNEKVFPITILTYLLGLVAIYLVSRRSRQSSKFVSSILGFLWLWSGIVLHILFYGPTYVEFLGMTIPGIWYFSGVLFVIQSLLFIVYGIVKNSLSFSLDISLYSIVGAIFVIYSMVIYPLIGFLTGYPYPKYPIFGSSPCPVTIFTLGLLLWTDKKIPLLVAIIPFIWGIMGIMPVLELSVYADIGLILSGIIGFLLILLQNRSIEK